MSAIKILAVHLAVLAAGVVGAFLYPLGVDWLISATIGDPTAVVLNAHRVSLAGFLLGAFLVAVAATYLWGPKAAREIPEHMIPHSIARSGDALNGLEVVARIRACVEPWALRGDEATIPSHALPADVARMGDVLTPEEVDARIRAAACNCTCKGEVTEHLPQIPESPSDDIVATLVIDSTPLPVIKPPAGTPTE